MTRRLTSTLGMLAIAALLGGCASLSEKKNAATQTGAAWATRTARRATPKADWPNTPRPAPR